MNQSQENKVERLEQKFLRIEELEAVVAPKGVNFSIRGQENFGPPRGLDDVESAADDVITCLEDALSRRNDPIAFEAMAKTVTLEEADY